MLGRLIQGHSKVPASLESTTEEAHSRSLLWPQHLPEHARGLLSSPPTTPAGSPTIRIGPFDDRGGLELNETKNVRVIIAQDAFGSMDRPNVLFDTHHQPASQKGGPNTKPEQPIPRNVQHRNRSSTISGPSAHWSRPTRDPENNDKLHRLLDCMFGVASATKSESSTKLHVLFSGSDQPASPSVPSPSLNRGPPRAPLIRSRTSIQVAPALKSPTLSRDDASVTEDVILVTRMFTVLLPESKEQVPRSEEVEMQGQASADSSGHRSDSFGTGKKPKLVEKKIPRYAIGLLLTMPPEDLRSNPSRPSSRTSFTSSSFPNSFGSDIASSWTILDTIADSLGSSAQSQKRADRRIQHVTNIWDVILRSLTWLEHIARSELLALLQQVNREIMASMVKTPKGPQEQRTNQRNVYIRTPLALHQARILHRSFRLVLQRISSALRIPRVVTGTGFLDGHWLDEARYLVQICASKPQNFFLNLLTAFLGNHTEWLEKLGASKTSTSSRRRHPNSTQNGIIASRTVIVADRRTIGRRLIFLLASFLPTATGASALVQNLTPLRSPLPTPALPSSSSLKSSFRASDVGQERQLPLRIHNVPTGAADVNHLSTSASSGKSVDSLGPAQLSRPQPQRNDSDAASIRTVSMFPISNSSLHMRKASAANAATTPQGINPVAHFAANRDGYFPEDAIADCSDSAASADLARILRRDSSSMAPTGMPSPKWPALLSGIWSRRPDTANISTGSPISARLSSELTRRDSTASSSRQGQPSSNKLESMVSERVGVDVPRSREAPPRSYQVQQSGNDPEAESVARSVEPPRLRVDEEDGVIDVDVGIAGFMSWEGDTGPISPPKDHHPSMSVQSLDGLSSMRSSLSHNGGRGGPSSGDSLNVAGFLKRYHEDFALQAVRPYEELQEEVKQSMLRESSSWDDGTDLPHSAKDTDEEDWAEVCSTLIADLRKNSVEHLILRRKRTKRPTSGAGQPTSQIQVTQDAQHRFVVEPVLEPDATLTEAIESILDTCSPGILGMSSSHKRTTSSSTAASNAVSTPPSSLLVGSTESRTRPQNSRANCRQVLTEALEEVVKSVKDDLYEQEGGRAIGRVSRHKKEEMSEENVLREGVRRWLLNEETRNVW